MDPNGRKVDIRHGNPCRCTVTDDGAIYVGPECERIGHHVTKRRLAQLVYALRQRAARDE